jgi:hypothetical protein
VSFKGGHGSTSGCRSIEEEEKKLNIDALLKSRTIQEIAGHPVTFFFLMKDSGL